MAIDERALDARRRAEQDLPATLRHVMAQRWGRVNYSEMSRRTGVPISTVRNHVIGRNPIPGNDIAAYAMALNVPAGLFFAGPRAALDWLAENPDDDDPDRLNRAIPGWITSLSGLAA